VLHGRGHCLHPGIRSPVSHGVASSIPLWLADLPGIRHWDAAEVGVAEASSVVTSAVTAVGESSAGEAFIAIRSGERSAGMSYHEP
jgi:hypothetical protein